MSEEVFVIDGKEYKRTKKGFAQAQQIASLGTWLSRHGKGVFSKIQEEAQDGEVEIGNADMVLSMFGAVTAEALVDLFEVVVGCPHSVAKKHFDLEILIDGVLAFFDNPAIRRVIDRFFTTNVTSDQTEESSPS